MTYRTRPTLGPICGQPQGCDHQSCIRIVEDHPCPIQVFLDDPITQAYGLGGDMDEWSRVLRCWICEEFA